MKKITLLFAAMLLTMGIAAQQHKSLSAIYKSELLNNKLEKQLKTLDMAQKFAATAKMSRTSSTIQSSEAELQKSAVKLAARRAGDEQASSRQLYDAYLNNLAFDKDWQRFGHRYMDERIFVIDRDTIMFPILQNADGSGIYARAYLKGKSKLFGELDVDSLVMPRRFVTTLQSGTDVYISGLDLQWDEDTQDAIFSLKDSITVYYVNDYKELYIPELVGLVSKDLSFQQNIMANLDFQNKEELDAQMLNAKLTFIYPDYDVTLNGDTVEVERTMTKLAKCLYYTDEVYVKDLSYLSAYNGLGAWLRMTVSESDKNVYELENMQRIASYGGSVGVYCYSVSAQGRLQGNVTFQATETDEGTVEFEQFGANSYYDLMLYNGGLTAFYGTDNLRFTVYSSEIVPTQTITIGESGYATFGDEEVTYQAPADLQVRYVTGMDENGLIYVDAPQNVIPAGEGVLLKGKPGDYEFTVVDTTQVKVKYNPNALYPSSMVDYFYNYFTEQGADMNDNFLFYKFTYNDYTREKLGWFWGEKNGNYFYNDRGKAMLMLRKASSDEARNAFLMDEEVNGITSIAQKHENQNVYFNMQGVRVGKPQQKGLYIVNNKKVIIK